MNNERKSTILVILVIILSLLILGLGGYIIYDKLNTTTENKENLIINNVNLSSNDLNIILDILGLDEAKSLGNNCMNAYISDNNFKNNSKKIFAWYIISHKLDTNNGQSQIIIDTNEDGTPDVPACGGAADCGSIKKSDADKIIKLYGLINIENQLTEMPEPYTDEYIINYFNLTNQHPISCNISTKHAMTIKENNNIVVVTDKQDVTEHDEYENIKLQKKQTVTYNLKKDINDNYYLDSVNVK